MKYRLIFIPLLFLSIGTLTAQHRSFLPEITPAGKGKVVPYADNIGYWIRMVRMGYVKPGESVPWIPARIIGTRLQASGIPPQDSPDIRVTSSNSLTQSENSVFIDPSDEDILLNSNNSTDWINHSAVTTYGADSYYSFTDGSTWSGSFEGAGSSNFGDPATAISFNGKWFVGMINDALGQSISYSEDQGRTWTMVQVAEGPTMGNGLLDKNHLWIDNSPSSPYRGTLYSAWTNFLNGNPDSNQIEISRSYNNGLHWYAPFPLSFGVTAGKFNHGVNISTGPLGEVYVAWSIYDTWPADEKAIGFTRSDDGGATWQTSRRILNNLKGIRNSGTGKNMRVNAFPSMSVDVSTGPNRGTIYMVFANVGFPGVNTGTDINVYLIKSTDKGETWSAPVKVNQDTPGNGKEHYFPWISCDAVTGGLCVIYYDDRNVSTTEAETWVSYSYDGGNSWSDFRVSDVSFTPSPIPGMAFNYFGDYIGIQTLNMKAYPMWTDNRLPGGQTMTWVSPFNLGPNPGQPWVIYYSNLLTEIPSGDTTVLKFGDSLHLSLGIKNIGDQPATNASVRLGCESPYIQLTDSVRAYGYMGAGETRVIANGFAFKVSDTIPDGTRVRFNLTITSNDTVWYSHVTLQAHALALSVIKLDIHDNTGGNNNGRLDPGETVDAVVTIANSGSYPCSRTWNILSTDSPYLDVVSDSAGVDTLRLNTFTNLHYTVTVSDSAPNSSGGYLYCTAKTANYIIHRRFWESIAIVTEDWESDSFSKFPWFFGGNTSWMVTNHLPYEGNYCSVSGPISDLQSSVLQVNYTSVVDDSISFHYKTSTEKDYDFLIFYIDGIIQDQWSGETPWTRASFPVQAGTHNYKWVYHKDISGAVGSDQVALDLIVFPSPQVPDIVLKKFDSVCAGFSYQVTASVQGADSIRWATAGDGMFNDSTLIEPVYTPGGQDIIHGSVLLKMTALGRYGRSIRTLNLTVAGLPVADISVSPKDTVCHWQTISLSADTSGVSTWLWTPGNITTPVAVIDTAIAGGLGSKLFHLKTGNKAGCYNTDSVWITFKACLGIQEIPKVFTAEISPNPSNGNFSLIINSPAPETIRITLENMNGKLISDEKNLTVPCSFSKKFNFAALPSGGYILKIYRKDNILVKKAIFSK